MSKPPLPPAGLKPETTNSPRNHNKMPLFSLGQIVATPGALEVFEQHGASPLDLLRRHQCGDWCDPGELCAEDQAANNLALRTGRRILSVYRVNGVRLYVITEAENDDGLRKSSCVLLPSEY